MSSSLPRRLTAQKPAGGDPLAPGFPDTWRGSGWMVFGRIPVSAFQGRQLLRKIRHPDGLNPVALGIAFVPGIDQEGAPRT